MSTLHYSEDLWAIYEKEFEINNNRKLEGLFTLGAPYLHIRGSVEEHISNAPQDHDYNRVQVNTTAEKFPDFLARWGTYVPGIYGKHPGLNEQLINLPAFFGIVPYVNGIRVDLTKNHSMQILRKLDMRRALIQRAVTYIDKSTDTLVQFIFERFVSATHPNVCAQHVTITSSTKANIAIETGIDAGVRTNGYDHLQNVEFSASSDNSLLKCYADTDRGDRFEILSAHHLSETSSFQKKNNARSSFARTEFVIDGAKQVEFTKVSAINFSRYMDRGIQIQEKDLQSFSYADLLTSHVQAWQQKWEMSDVIIEGDADAQIAIRSSIFHLLRSVPWNRQDVSVDAKGYAGEAYYGRFFWDSEIYLLPFFLYTDPKSAGALAQYRVATLGQAMKNAERFQYPGAKYAWEADADGNECCGLWQYRDLEVHINADVVYGIAHYCQATGNEDLLKTPEFAAVIREVSRYWAARVDKQEGDQGYHLLGVMGPDEYMPLSNDNAYTNRMVRFVLELAIQLGAKTLGAKQSEIDLFQSIASSLPIHRSGNLVLQAKNFPQLAEPDFAKFWPNRKKTYASQVPQEKIYRTKNLKQADVLLLMMLFGNEFSQEEVVAAWNYYMPVTTHDSSLSAGIHSIIASALGKSEEAWNFWLDSSMKDLDLESGGAAEGIHIANAAANWMMITYGFAGWRDSMQTTTLEFSSRLPKKWHSINFAHAWHGQEVDVEMGHHFSYVFNKSEKPLDCILEGESVNLDSRKGHLHIKASNKTSSEARAVIFDLDGVITDTAELHYLAWKELADSLGVEFDRIKNHGLRGVGRLDSLKLILGDQASRYSVSELEKLAGQKNELYLQHLADLSPKHILPGVENLLQGLRMEGFRTGLASASKNAGLVVDRLGLRSQFDAIGDANRIARGKPDPQIFLRTSALLNVSPQHCFGVEDADAGMQSIKAAGMCAIGIGDAVDPSRCDYHFKTIDLLKMSDFKSIAKI